MVLAGSARWPPNPYGVTEANRPYQEAPSSDGHSLGALGLNFLKEMLLLSSPPPHCGSPLPLPFGRTRGIYGAVVDEHYVPSKAEKEAFYASWEWKMAAYRARKFYGYKCLCCGAGPNQERIVVDHIQPLSLRWDLRLDRDNLQLLCDPCNMGKSNVDATDFRPPVTRVVDSGPYRPISIAPPCPARYKGGPKIDRAASLSKLKLCKPYFQMTDKIAQRLGLASWTQEQLAMAGLCPYKTKGWIKRLIGREFFTKVFEDAFCARN